MLCMESREFGAAAVESIDALASYIEESVDVAGPAVARRPPAAVLESLDVRRLMREGGLAAASFGDWLRRYLADSTRLHHPSELAHQVGVPDVGSALAELVHGVANQTPSIYEMGAGAAAVDHAVLEWMFEKVGWDARSAGGVLTHGGSLANLTALLAARAKAAPDAWSAGTPADLAILAPPSAHYSIARAAGILGLGADAILPLEVDALERVRVDRLPNALARARALGRRPMALVAAACATSTGLHDDLRGIGEFCREHGIWLHVDGAHGASALLSERLRGLLDGIELADSVVWDAHKMLRTSALCAAVLVRRGADLPAAFRQQASRLRQPEWLRRDRPPGRMHEGRARAEAVSQPRVSRRARTRRLRRGAVREGADVLGAAARAARLRCAVPAGEQHRLLPVRAGRRGTGGDPRGAPRAGRVPPQLGRDRRRAPPARHDHVARDRRGDVRPAARRDRGRRSAGGGRRSRGRLTPRVGSLSRPLPELSPRADRTRPRCRGRE
jgi:Pyridoxal-dependent decarboxylase conserved domain